MNPPTRNSIILVDTNAIAAAHKLNCWNALKRSYKLHTVELCIEEATRPNRQGRRLVDRDPDQLKSDFAKVVMVDKKSQAELMLAVGNRNDVDEGERDLLAYAKSLSGNVWWLCGPDNGTVHAMRILRLFERMVSLEAIAQGCGHRFKSLPQNYSEEWLANHRRAFLFDDL
ncbi:hypothetical protein [Pelagicoccus sp. SDUM812003]|uniref:hypothetical protein n=1 Tax=Pelagicoccus sp. SDUM812003 TaxID=3041267 RepID=UPI0028105A07|nr:hypothetical protein [Pelagicoccus sp. SDUM812003]MDQ8204213.1 hypothetical protein [Pelagicoccus sp. SDUM812003]